MNSFQGDDCHLKHIFECVGPIPQPQTVERRWWTVSHTKSDHQTNKECAKHSTGMAQTNTLLVLSVLQHCGDCCTYIISRFIEANTHCHPGEPNIPTLAPNHGEDGIKMPLCLHSVQWEGKTPFKKLFVLQELCELLYSKFRSQLHFDEHFK